MIWVLVCFLSPVCISTVPIERLKNYVVLNLHYVTNPLKFFSDLCDLDFLRNLLQEALQDPQELKAELVPPMYPVPHQSHQLRNQIQILKV